VPHKDAPGCYAVDGGVKFKNDMKALSIFSIVIGCLSILSGLGYLLAASEQSESPVIIGFVQIWFASLLAASGWLSLKNISKAKRYLAPAWLLFIGFCVYVLS
jgi:hypothetical protein